MLELSPLPPAGLKTWVLPFQLPAPAKPGRGGEWFRSRGPCQSRQALACLPPESWTLLSHLLFHQPPVTLRDTSIENLRNQGHTGRKPPSQPSNPASHLAAYRACPTGHQRGTTQPQNPQPGLGAPRTPVPWLPAPAPPPTRALSPHTRLGVTKQEKSPERESCDNP